MAFSFFKRWKKQAPAPEASSVDEPLPAADPVLAEKRAFAEYLCERAGDPDFLRYTDWGEIDGAHLLNHRIALYEARSKIIYTLDGARQALAYDDASYNRYFKIDTPLTEEMRTLFPHAIGTAKNLRELIDPPLLECMGLVAYYWSEAKIDEVTFKATLRMLPEHLRDNVGAPAEEMLGDARKFMEYDYIPLEDLKTLSSMVYSDPTIYGEMDKDASDGDTQALAFFDGETESLMASLQEYQATLERQGEPNAAMLSLLTYLRVSLSNELIMPNTVMHFLATYHPDFEHSPTSQLNPLVAVRDGYSFSALKDQIATLIAHDKGENRGYSM